MDFIASTEYIRFHFWIPIPTLVTKMNSRAEHFFHADRHVLTFLFGLSLYTPHQSTYKNYQGTQITCVGVYATLNLIKLN